MAEEALRVDTKQIMDCIADGGLTPSALSPFHGVEPAAEKSRERQADLMPFVKVVAWPLASVGMIVLSPEGVLTSRVYAGGGRGVLVRHWIDHDGLHNFRRVHEKDIADEASQRLMLDIPPARLDYDTKMSEATFLSFLALIDGWREKKLLSLIGRKPDGKFSFTGDEPYDSFHRSITSKDVRWLTPLVSMLYTGDLVLSLDLFRESLKDLSPKFVQSAGPRWELTPLGEELCAMLGAPLAAMKLTVSMIKNGAIVEENLIGLRGMAIYCVLELDEKNKEITLKNSSAPMIEQYIHFRLAKASKTGTAPAAENPPQDPPEAVASSPQPRAASEPAPAKKFCSGCGKPLQPGAKFCSGCGTKIT
ncbi:MAG TPA: zinc ribbon domain-containing protein [Smithellaceae bacterium]|jgi:hypothetical protein|nr:zinc ribbon domain-containing protein [Smithellaceae bacterium]